MDLLSDVLAVTGVRGTLGARIEAAEEWGVRWSGIRGAAFYAVTAGTAWLGLPGRPPFQLMPGDVVLLPNGAEHTLSSAPDTEIRACDCEAAAQAKAEAGVLRFGSGEVRTHVLGASYEYDPAVSLQILTLLPEVVHLRADNSGSGLDDTVRLLARELVHTQVATAVVLNRLVDVLLVQLLRVLLTRKADELRGTWLGVLGDPLVSVAMTKLHHDPARAWTVDSLAAELAVSRTTLSRRFLSVAGETPGGYLTRWRMDLAAVRLRDSDEPLEAIARSVGYTSVYAFSRAFRRARSQAPGQYRIASRATDPRRAPAAAPV
ncbi:AraC family transcriptional regulator [Streptomyces sp. NPDC055025]